MERVVKKDFQFSDGYKIPKGTFVAVNAIGPDMDASVFPNPETFDAFRFSNLRDIPGNETKFQFVTSGADALSWGHGVHACPGQSY